MNPGFDSVVRYESEDGRAVKACDSSSHGAIFVGSSPTPRILLYKRASLRPLQVRPLQFLYSAYQKYNEAISLIDILAKI